MKKQHYSTIKSSMSYIEKLLREIEAPLNLKEKKIYTPVKIDLSEEQIKLIKSQLKKLHKDLEKMKKIFNLKVEPIKLSKIIDVSTSYIWETIEDSWSSKMEKMYGKIKSENKKRQIDSLLKEILESTNKIREISKI